MTEVMKPIIFVFFIVLLSVFFTIFIFRNAKWTNLSTLTQTSYFPATRDHAFEWSSPRNGIALFSFWNVTIFFAYSVNSLVFLWCCYYYYCAIIMEIANFLFYIFAVFLRFKQQLTENPPNFSLQIYFLGVQIQVIIKILKNKWGDYLLNIYDK